MIKLAATVYSIIGSTLAGTSVVIALVSGFDGAGMLIAAAIAGFVIAIPVALLVARALIRG